MVDAARLLSMSRYIYAVCSRTVSVAVIQAMCIYYFRDLFGIRMRVCVVAVVPYIRCIGVQKMHFIRFRECMYVSSSEIGVFWHNPSRELHRSTSRVMGVRWSWLSSRRMYFVNYNISR